MQQNVKILKIGEFSTTIYNGPSYFAKQAFVRLNF